MIVSRVCLDYLSHYVHDHQSFQKTNFATACVLTLFIKSNLLILYLLRNYKRLIFCTTPNNKSFDT